MQRIEQQPKEIRLAYVSDELKRIVDRAETEQEAREACELKFRELLEQGVLPNDTAETNPIRNMIVKKIKLKFADEETKIRVLDELKRIVDKAETEQQAREVCEERLRELVEQGIVPNSIDDVQTITDTIRESIKKKFEVSTKIKLKDINHHYTSEEIIEAYEEKIRLNPNFITYYSPYYRKLGGAYYSLERYEEAVESYQAAIRLDPDNARCHRELGDSYYELKKYEEAIEAFEEAIRLNPGLERFYRHKSRTAKILLDSTQN